MLWWVYKETLETYGKCHRLLLFHGSSYNTMYTEKERVLRLYSQIQFHWTRCITTCPSLGELLFQKSSSWCFLPWNLFVDQHPRVCPHCWSECNVQQVFFAVCTGQGATTSCPTEVGFIVLATCSFSYQLFMTVTVNK